METKKHTKSWASPMMLTFVGKNRKPVFRKMYVYANGETAFLDGFDSGLTRTVYGAVKPSERIFFTEHSIRSAAKRKANGKDVSAGVTLFTYDGTLVDPAFLAKGETLVEYITKVNAKGEHRFGKTPKEAADLVVQLMAGVLSRDA